MARAHDICVVCGEERELATVRPPLCFKHYREKERNDENPWRVRDRFNRAQRKAQNATRKSINQVLSALDNMPLVKEEDGDSVRALLRPYLLQMAEALPAKVTASVNTSAKSAETVHSVNSEQENGEVVHTGASASDSKPAGPVFRSASTQPTGSAQNQTEAADEMTDSDHVGNGLGRAAGAERRVTAPPALPLPPTIPQRISIVKHKTGVAYGS